MIARIAAEAREKADAKARVRGKFNTVHRAAAEADVKIRSKAEA